MYDTRYYSNVYVIFLFLCCDNKALLFLLGMSNPLKFHIGDVLSCFVLHLTHTKILHSYEQLTIIDETYSVRKFCCNKTIKTGTK